MIWPKLDQPNRFRIVKVTKIRQLLAGMWRERSKWQEANLACKDKLKSCDHDNMYVITYVVQVITVCACVG